LKGIITNLLGGLPLHPSEVEKKGDRGATRALARHAGVAVVHGFAIHEHETCSIISGESWLHYFMYFGDCLMTIP
jgi:hypothetical protein